MAGYVLHLSTEENITLSSATVKRLIAGGSGDAALLYLASCMRAARRTPASSRASSSGTKRVFARRSRRSTR